MLNVAIYIYNVGIQCLFNFNSMAVKFNSVAISIISFNSKKIHPQFTVKTRSNSLLLRHSKFQPCSGVIGLLLSWRMIFPLKRCFVIFVAFGKNVVALINTYSLVQTKYQNNVPLRRDQQLTCNFKFVLRYSNI